MSLDFFLYLDRFQQVVWRAFHDRCYVSPSWCLMWYRWFCCFYEFLLQLFAKFWRPRKIVNCFCSTFTLCGIGHCKKGHCLQTMSFPTALVRERPLVLPTLRFSREFGLIFLWSCRFLRLAGCLLLGFELKFACFLGLFFRKYAHFGLIFSDVPPCFFCLIFLPIFYFVEFSCQTPAGLVFWLHYLFWACFSNSCHHWRPQFSRVANSARLKPDFEILFCNTFDFWKSNMAFSGFLSNRKASFWRNVV